MKGGGHSCHPLPPPPPPAQQPKKVHQRVRVTPIIKATLAAATPQLQKATEECKETCKEAADVAAESLKVVYASTPQPTPSTSTAPTEVINSGVANQPQQTGAIPKAQMNSSNHSDDIKREFKRAKNKYLVVTENPINTETETTTPQESEGMCIMQDIIQSPTNLILNLGEIIRDLNMSNLGYNNSRPPMLCKHFNGRGCSMRNPNFNHCFSRIKDLTFFHYCSWCFKHFGLFLRHPQTICLTKNFMEKVNKAEILAKANSKKK